MVRLAEQVVGSDQQGISLSLQGSPAATLGFRCTLGQPGKETIHLLSHLGGCAKASVGRHFLPCPVPDSLIRIQVRAVGRQGHELQPQVWRRQIFPYLGTAMRRAVVPDDEGSVHVKSSDNVTGDGSFHQGECYQACPFLLRFVMGLAAGGVE